MSSNLPGRGQIFLDHLAYFVADLDVAGDTLSRLGFRVSGVNVQQNFSDDGSLVPTGTSNRLAMLEHGFVEVLAPTGATPLADQMRAGLKRYQGLHLIALSHPDVDAERARLIEAGFDMQPLLSLRRPVKAGDEERLTNIRMLRTQPAEMPEGRVQVLTNHTPDLFWTPGSSIHDNSVVAVTSVLLCVENPTEVAQRYARYSGRPSQAAAGHYWIQLDRGTIAAASHDRVASYLPGFAAPGLPRMAAMALRARELAAVRRALARSGIEPLSSNDRAVLVGPSDALGSYVLFHVSDFDRRSSVWDLLAAYPGESRP